MSEQKARDFIEGVTGKPLSDKVAGRSVDALLETAKKSLDIRRTDSQSSLEGEAAELARCRGNLENLRDIQNKISTREFTVQSKRRELMTVLGDLTFDELREKLETAKYRATTESIKRRIVDDAILFIGRTDSESVPCPICTSHHNRQTLESTLRDAATKSDNDSGSTVAALESQLQRSEALHSLLSEQEPILISLKARRDQREGNYWR